MGLYTDISNSSDSAKNVALYNRQNGVSGHTLLGLTLSQYGPSLVMQGASKLGNLLNGSEKAEDDGKGGSVDNDKQRKELEKKLNKALNAIGASDQNDINEAVTRAQNSRDEKVNAAQVEVDTLTTSINTTQQKITECDTKLSQLNDTNDPDGTKRAEIEADKEKFEAQLQKDTKSLETKQKELEKTIETENKKVSEISGKASEALSYLDELNALNSIDDEDTESVPEATEALNELAEYRNILNSKTESTENKQKIAKRIQMLVVENPDNKTLQNAYKMIKNQVNDIIQGKNLERYQNADTTSKAQKWSQKLGI